MEPHVKIIAPGNGDRHGENTRTPENGNGAMKAVFDIVKIKELVSFWEVFVSAKRIKQLYNLNY